MVEKDKTLEAPDAPKAPEKKLGGKDVVEALKGMTADERKKILDLMKAEDGQEKPADKEAAPHAPEHAPKPSEAGHNEHAPHTAETHVPQNVPTDAAHTAPEEDLSGKLGAMESPKKIAALGTLAGLSAVGSLAAAGSNIVPAALSNSWAVTGAANALSWVGGGLNAISNAMFLGWTGPVAPAAIGAGLGFAGLYGIGKIVNGVHRLWNPDAEKATGLRPAWLGVKAVTSPIWGGVKLARWGIQKLIDTVPTGASAVTQRVFHEVRNGLKWGTIGALGLGGLSVLATGGVTAPLLLLYGPAAGYATNAAYRVANRFVMQQPSTLGAAADDHSHAAPADAPPAGPPHAPPEQAH